MTTVATTTLVIAGFLVLISLVQPASERLHLPYSVLLAVVGIAVSALASFLLYTPLASAVHDIVRPLVDLPFNASIFLVVFLPVLLFHAALTIDLREIAEDAAPILLLAIVAVFAAAAAIGFGLSLAAGVPLTVALLLGAIVATTDPAAVVAIFRELGTPPRLTRLLEGEALLNDAAAIVLFTILVDMLTGAKQLDIAHGIQHFFVEFLGGIVLGVVGGRVYGAALGFFAGSRMAEVTLAVALPYIVYLLGDLFHVSGVVAVAGAGLIAGTIGRVRMTPDNWEYLEQVWEQMGFWASSLIFIAASDLVPRLLGGLDFSDLWPLVIVIVAAFASRAAVLFVLLPLLSALRLSQRVSASYKLAVTWGGLRGAVTLALALSVTENREIPAEIKDTIAVLATGFVLFTLLVNGLSLRPVIHLLKLDRLSPLDQAIRAKVLALSLGEVRDAVRETASEYAIAPGPLQAVSERYQETIDELAEQPVFESAISDQDRLTVGLIALTNRERRMILHHHAQHTVSGTAIERLLRNTNHILDAAKDEGLVGYNRAASELLRFSHAFRIANFLHRTMHLDRPLQHEISVRFETLLVRRLVLEALTRFTGRRLRALVGDKMAEQLGDVVGQRMAATVRALDALRLQYPEHADTLERRFLQQSGLRLLEARYHELHEEGLIGRELFDALGREHRAGRQIAAENPPLDLGLRTEELIGEFDMFSGLGPAERKALVSLFRPRLLVPDELIIRKGERGNSMFLISSGAVEVLLPDTRVRLGSGEFFGEMALLSGAPRQADVVALGYCRVLVLSAADFGRFLRNFPRAREEIDRVVEARNRENAASATA